MRLRQAPREPTEEEVNALIRDVDLTQEEFDQLNLEFWERGCPHWPSDIMVDPTDGEPCAY
jgi:hypothetical protein